MQEGAEAAESAVGGSRIAGGLALLGPQETALLRLLDDAFRDWGAAEGAMEISAPPLFPVQQLAELDVYVNFPQLAFVAGGLKTPGSGPAEGRFAPEQLTAPSLGLSHATCFAAYRYLQGRQVAADTLVTLVNRCFRREDHFDGLRRLLSFQMREIVAVGTFEHTQEVITRYRERIEALLGLLGLAVVVEEAADPFFQGGTRALLQRMAPVKYEFRVDSLAIASVNSHRNFFGERCRITYGEEHTTAFTSCIAFGLERWLAVLIDRHGSVDKARTTVEQALHELGPA